MASLRETILKEQQTSDQCLELKDGRPVVRDCTEEDRTSGKFPSLGAGVKFDQGKLPWHLIAWDAIAKIAVILEFGAKKYAPRNWEKGMDYSRPFGALMRHLTQWWNGEDKDQESGYSHLWHAGCNLMFLIAYELRGVGKDDRPIPRPPYDPNYVTFCKDHQLPTGDQG